MLNRKYLPFHAFFLTSLITSPATLASDSGEFALDANMRMRYESLTNAFRRNAEGSDQILVSRFLGGVKFTGDHWLGQLEVEDARAWLDDQGTPLGTDDVNTLEPLQAWFGWRSNDGLTLKAGRMSFDIGSRRLMARQRFRNTLNAFDGIYSDLHQGGSRLQSFYVKPVARLPGDRESLAGNDQSLDEQGDDSFWGLHYSRSGASVLELFYYGLNENDGAKLSTVGARNLKTPSEDQWHHEIEAAYQWGDTEDLTVNAAMVHAHLGYQYADAWRSRLELLFDYASGDKDPDDNHSERFNTLFGVTRFDFGPTGIYGAVARTNLLSPGVRWNFTPFSHNTALVTYRALWLDSAKDSQSRSNLRDDRGDTGRFVGHQLELRWRTSINKHWQWEIGGAYLRKGRFFEDAPNAPATGDSTYGYTQVVFQR